MTLLLMFPGSQNTIAGALTNCESALFNLRKSNGYRAAKKANPKPESFARTFTGRAEQDIEAAIQLLGGPPSPP